MNLPSINLVPFILLCVWGPRAAAALEKNTVGCFRILQSWETNHHTHSPFFTGIAKEKNPLSTICLGWPWYLPHFRCLRFPAFEDFF